MNQHSVSYDIDHPQAIYYVQATLKAAARLFGCSDGLDSWILANEPNFYSTPSLHAKEKYVTFLKRKYHSNLQGLHAAWRDGSGGRDDLPWSWEEAAQRFMNAEAPDEDEAIRSAMMLTGGGGSGGSSSSMDSGARRRWLDWSAFNSQRVTRWARSLRSALKEVNACHRASIKFNTAPNFPSGVITNGIDRPAMLHELDISGLDQGFPPPWDESEGGHGASRGVRANGNLLWYDNRKYSCDWLHVAFSLSFIKSIAPTKPIANWEWHLITDCCTTARTHQTDASLLRVRVWFTALLANRPLLASKSAADASW